MNELPIVVGYDTSASARQALDWALAEGRRRSAPVQVIHVLEWPLRHEPVLAAPAALTDAQLHNDVTARIEQAVAAAAASFPGVSVSCRVVDGAAAQTLCDASQRARMLVLGSRGLGGFTGLMIGSVSAAVAAHAHSPVIVVRGEPVDATRRLPIVVGVDDSPQAYQAAGFAFDQAATHGADLIAVRAWTPPARPQRPGIRPMSDDVEGADNAERFLVNSALADARSKHPGVPVTVRLVAGNASDTLVTASRQAQLVVVGSRGRGGFGGLLLGSVSQQLLHHAQCPVAVVREISSS